MTELKPCPECGSDYLNIMTEHTSGNRVIHCMDCHKYYDELNLTREDSPSDIISKWNEYALNYNPAPKTEPALKPCPFCGSKRVGIIEPDYFGDDNWVARCHCCGANVSGIDRKDAIETWNRRVKE